MKRHFILAAALFLLAAGTAMSAGDPTRNVPIDRAGFEATKSHLIAELDDERYKEIAAEDKKTVIAALDRISTRLAKPQPMNDQDAVDTFNDEELINTITSHAARESRLYCERDMPTGSHRIRVVCLTIAKWMERQRDGQRAMTQIETNHRSSCSTCP
jgi:hypothetical protein